MLHDRNVGFLCRLADLTAGERNRLVVVDPFTERNTLCFDLVNSMVKCPVKIEIFNLRREDMVLAAENNARRELISVPIHNDVDRSYLEGGISKKCVQTVFNMLSDRRSDDKLASCDIDAHNHLHVSPDCGNGFHPRSFAGIASLPGDFRKGRVVIL